MMIKSFDLINSGWVSLKKTALTLCLLSASVPTEQNLNDYKDALLSKTLEEHHGDHYVGKNVFIKVATWFDENEISIDQPSYHPYTRVRNLKSIIFDMMRNEDYLLNIEELIGLLSIKIPGRSIKFYRDVLIIPTDDE
mmetsp:Transcript_27239/g.24130  ORF Transcript_27239/g.24130 Transcript_27239/m.24130 type:complete len:138 (+) Transcript_27239:310-723(+)